MKNQNAAKMPTAQDRYLGERIREARIATGMSQKELGGLIGVSYQQLQKYETGQNRINGGRIERLISALNRPFNYFYPNVTDVRSHAEPFMNQFIASKDGHFVAENWFRMSLPARNSMRGLISELVKE